MIICIFATDMKNILKVETPNDYARFVDASVLHPLISIIHYDELAPFRHSLNNYGVYGLFIQRQFPNTLSYGMKTLQVSDKTMASVSRCVAGCCCGRPNCCTAPSWNAR